MKIKILKKQSGITLITSLVMLLVMTVIGLTAIRLSTIDLVVAKNYQHQLTVYQAAESALRKDVNFYHLYEWMLDNTKHPGETTDEGVVSETLVVDLEKDYICKGRQNQATSIGPDAPSCKLFMFTIDSHLEGTGAKDRHYQGAGKQVPNASKGSYL